jgi:hypothetical protein
MNAFAGAALRVSADRRAGRWRRRRLVVGSALVLGLLSTGFAYSAWHGGGHRAPGQRSAPAHTGTVLRGGDLVLYGHRAFVWGVHAPAGLAYDVQFTAPVASRAVVTMQIARGVGWTFSTRDDRRCRTSAGRTTCLLHFASGGNPGGTWRADVRNTTASTADLRLLITFFKPTRPQTR